MKREFSAGGVVFRNFKISSVFRNGKNSKLKIVWLLAKSTPSEIFPVGFWRLPKGWLDDTSEGKIPGPLASGTRKATEHDIQSAAVREVREEGGVEAKIIEKIGTEKYFYTFNGEKILKFVTFYLMEWVKDLPEGPGFETEKIEWLPYEKARKKLKNSAEKKVIEKAKKILDSGLQQNLV